MSAAPARSAPPPPPPEDDTGASPQERLLAAAKHDNEEMMNQALLELEDVNYVDGLGNSALHYAIMNASTGILELLLEHEECDLDARNRLHGDTPLHIAVRNKWEEHEGMRLFLVGSLLESGANTKVKNRYNQRPIDLLPPSHESADLNSDDERIRAAIRRTEAEEMVAWSGDVAEEDDMVDPDDVASDSD
ncbi:hypothetical protein IAU60_001156 [Kwoniella sp. DSM 27419]